MTKAMSKTIAVIGCGAVVEFAYAEALQRLSRTGWRICFVDTDAKRSEQMAAIYKNSCTAVSVAEVPGRAGHAIVATPPSAHFSTCSALLDGGVHVICEKPFVTVPDEGFALALKARKSGLKMQVNQTRRWFPSALAARRIVSEGALGELKSVSVRTGSRFKWASKTAFYSEPSLQRNGILYDQGSHLFDLLGWITGLPLEPLEVGHDGYAGPESTVRVRFSAGIATGFAVATWLVEAETRIVFTGTRGSVTLADDCNRAVLAVGSKVRAVHGPTRYHLYGDIIADVFEAFVAGGDHPAVATAESVMPSVVFLDRAHRMGRATLPYATVLEGAPQ